MPVIVPINPKGGSGKSTVCLALATTFAANGASVCVLDADPQGSLLNWAKGESKFKTIISKPDEDEDLDQAILREAENHKFVLVDLQGSANLDMVAAVSCADMVLIPMQAKMEDARRAIEALKMLQRQERILKRKIPYALLLTRTNPGIKSREEKSIREKMEQNAVVMINELNERTALSCMFTHALTMAELDPKAVSGIDKAQDNVNNLIKELLVKFLQNNNQQAHQA